ncbi:MarR family transcriptional regulator [Ewingella americana]|nr:MarR family transcriptional regulator [Ewingella americana]
MSKMNDDEIQRACTTRQLLEQITDKWSIVVLCALSKGPLRFNEIKRRLEGITQKTLTQCLRKLERSGILVREVLPVSPVAVIYSVTPLGRTLEKPFFALFEWTQNSLADVTKAQQAYDQREGL